jgi:excisionase family DNA binding protein
MFDLNFTDALAAELTPRLVAQLAPLLKPEPLPQQEWFTRKQAAHYTGSTMEGLRHMLREKLLAVYHVAGRERIKKADIDRFWEEGKCYLKS